MNFSKTLLKKAETFSIEINTGTAKFGSVTQIPQVEIVLKTKEHFLGFIPYTKTHRIKYQTYGNSVEGFFVSDDFERDKEFLRDWFQYQQTDDEEI